MSFLQNQQIVWISLTTIHSWTMSLFLAGYSSSCFTEKVGCRLTYWRARAVFQPGLVSFVTVWRWKCEHGNDQLLAGWLKWWWTHESYRPGFLEDTLEFWSWASVSYLSKPAWMLKMWENSKLMCDTCRFDNWLLKGIHRPKPTKFKVMLFKTIKPRK